MVRPPEPPTGDNGSMSGSLHRYTAFSTDPRGGNPAGVWIGDQLPSAGEMQRIAREVGFSETAFIEPAAGPVRRIRYFSPASEVTFCGHATIASGVALGDLGGDGTYELHTRAGVVPVSVSTRDGQREASLTSVPTRHELASHQLVEDTLAALGWAVHDLDSRIPPARAYAGAWHLVLAVAGRSTLDGLDYDFDRLRQVMDSDGLTTLQLIWKESDAIYHSRNPFPVGGVVEDPATGAAAAALGGYLRDARLLAVPAHIVIRQGEAIGRPSRLDVAIPESGGIVVSGPATRLAD